MLAFHTEGFWKSLRTWFVFPEIPSGASVKVIVISGDGKRKEKELGQKDLAQIMASPHAVTARSSQQFSLSWRIFFPTHQTAG
jgi:hypothetical protein